MGRGSQVEEKPAAVTRKSSASGRAAPSLAGVGARNQEYLSAEGIERLQSQLEEMKTAGRAQVAEQIKHAREFGDISENAEYDTAKNEQALLEGRIINLEDRLGRAQLLEDPKPGEGKIVVGSTVRYKDEKTGEGTEFRIVGSLEANLAEGKLSMSSPTAQALLGAKRGDLVTVHLPSGRKRKLKVTKVA